MQINKIDPSINFLETSYTFSTGGINIHFDGTRISEPPCTHIRLKLTAIKFAASCAELKRPRCEEEFQCKNTKYIRIPFPRNTLTPFLSQ